MTDPHYLHLLKRSEMLDRILAVVSQQEALAPESPAPQASHPPLRLAVLGYRLLCNGQSLDLARRPLALKLFESFLAAPGYRMTLPEVIASLYGASDPSRHTKRFLESLKVNAIKAISRARILAQEAFDECVGVEWLAHDRGVWYLYKLAPGAIIGAQSSKHQRVEPDDLRPSVI